MPGETSSLADYAAATDHLRTATRWLLTAAAAAGAAMIAGLQLTSIGSLGFADWPRLLAAGAGLAAGLGAVGYMVFRTSRLLTDEWITLAQLELEQFKQQLRQSRRRRDQQRAAAIDRIYGELESYQDELYGNVADSISDLYSRLIKANELARGAGGPESEKTAAVLKDAVDMLVQAANYSYVRADFTVLRRHLAQAAAVFITGIVIFAYAANPPKPVATNSAASKASPAVSHRPGPVPKTAAPRRGTLGLP